jgi:hypothetical protein
MENATHAGPGYWVSRVVIPVDRLGIDSLTPLLTLQAAVCRYDYNGEPTPVLSTTAPLRAACFHRRHEWPQVVLSSTL